MRAEAVALAVDQRPVAAGAGARQGKRAHAVVLAEQVEKAIRAVDRELAAAVKIVAAAAAQLKLGAVAHSAGAHEAGRAAQPMHVGSAGFGDDHQALLDGHAETGVVSRAAQDQGAGAGFLEGGRTGACDLGRPPRGCRRAR